MERKLYQRLATIIQARENCRKSGNTEWFDRHEQRAEHLCKTEMPSGSGFDSGTRIDFDASSADKLVFDTAYHHMNDNGMYDGWTTHRVIVRPSLASGYYLRITGSNRNEFKDYAHDTFAHCLEQLGE